MLKNIYFCIYLFIIVCVLLYRLYFFKCSIFNLILVPVLVSLLCVLSFLNILKCLIIHFCVYAFMSIVYSFIYHCYLQTFYKNYS